MPNITDILDLGEGFDRYTEDFKRFQRPDFSRDDSDTNVPDGKASARKPEKKKRRKEPEVMEEKHNILLSLPVGLFSQLKILAALQGKSFTGFVNACLEESVRDALKKNEALKTLIEQGKE